jgi:uncharacterized protein YdhG (YjbR/CyaY superfamily)
MAKEAEMKKAKIAFKETGPAQKSESAAGGFLSIDEYIRSRPKGQQKSLKEIRKAIREALPEAKETISYRMPAFYLKGILLYFASYDRHIGLYPTSSGIEAFAKEFGSYKSAKGSVQFPLGKPMPLDLIVRIAKFRARENEDRFLAKQRPGNKK